MGTDVSERNLKATSSPIKEDLEADGSIRGSGRRWRSHLANHTGINTQKLNVVRQYEMQGI
jgi:hypothetical protein